MTAMTICGVFMKMLVVMMRNDRDNSVSKGIESNETAGGQ
jgi:hypothetical protein